MEIELNPIEGKGFLNLYKFDQKGNPCDEKMFKSLGAEYFDVSDISKEIVGR